MIPVVLFAYNRPTHLLRTLSCLKADRVPLLYAFSDGPRVAEHRDAVSEVREILGSIDWCETRIQERPENLGLGRSIVTGVSEVLPNHEAALVFEDDLICVPGTYAYLSAALTRYADEPNVMSVTGWTHPRVIPRDVSNGPYFDGRAECLVWGTWPRAWQGMERSALELMDACRARGIDVCRYGADLPEMAQEELKRNIWAVRWLYLHILQGGLCFRPPWSMVEHIGFDDGATNAGEDEGWSNPPLRDCPPIPETWPHAVEHPSCSRIWRSTYGSGPATRRLSRWKAGLRRRWKALNRRVRGG